MEKGQLFVISGPSGTGKGTICNKLLSKDKTITLSISMTTRAPRGNEVEGKEYYFTTVDNFKKVIDEEGLLEYAEVYGNYYGTPKDKVLKILEDGKNVLLEIDVDGALQVKRNYKDAILIFILPPSMEELERRIRGRGTESEEKLKIRMKSAASEMEYSKEYDFCVVNEILDDAVIEIEEIIGSTSS